MREKIRQKLQSYRDGDGHRGSDGDLHVVDGVTRITWEQSERLAELHERVRPDLSVETGLAYGFSTLPILDAMDQHQYGRHIAIDPTQMRKPWYGVAYTSIQELELGSRFTLVETPSDQALVALVKARERIQFIFLDGVHSLDGYMTDFFLTDQLMDEGGLFVLNDMWIAPARAMRSFLRSNIEHYEEIPNVDNNVFVMRKQGRDRRVWDHFAAFDGTGGKDKKANLFQRLVGVR